MKILLLLVFTIFTSYSFAGTIFEPTISLGSGDGKISASAENFPAVSRATSATTATFGFRYGITRRYIQVTGMLEGMVFASGHPGAKTEFLGFGGIGIGYEWNIPIRTYIIIGAYDFDTDYMSNGFELSYYLSKSMWLGVRYTKFKYEVGANLINADTSQPVFVNSKINLASVSLVLSMPFEFNYPDHWFRKMDWD